MDTNKKINEKISYAVYHNDDYKDSPYFFEHYTGDFSEAERLAKEHTFGGCIIPFHGEPSKNGWDETNIKYETIYVDGIKDTKLRAKVLIDIFHNVGFLRFDSNSEYFKRDIKALNLLQNRNLITRDFLENDFYEYAFNDSIKDPHEIIDKWNPY